MLQVGRVQPHAVNAPGQAVGNVEFLGSALHEDAGRGNAVAGFGLDVENRDFQSSHCGGLRRGEPGKTRTANH